MHPTSRGLTYNLEFPDANRSIVETSSGMLRDLGPELGKDYDDVVRARIVQLTGAGAVEAFTHAFSRPNHPDDVFKDQAA